MVKSVENKPVEVSKSQIAATAKKAMLRIVFWVLFLGILYGLWLNPQIITNMVKFISMQTATEESQEENTVREDEFYRRMNVLQNQINQLQNQISSLPEGSSATVDLSRFDSKLEAIEKQNLNVIDSKADVATVLGIITRLDKIEERLDTLAKISDDGALVLTATMMVKESSEKYQGEVPHNREALENLAGVGRKTANVVLNVWFNEPTLAVDTHVMRISHRLNMSDGKNPLEVEKDLLKVLPDNYKKNANHWLVLFGRYICKAQKPDCPNCPVSSFCHSADKRI